MPRHHAHQVRTLTGTVVPLHRSMPLASVQGTLALDVSPRYTPPAFEVADRAPVIDADHVGATRRRELEAWAMRYAQAAVEIVGGDRPTTQLVRWTAGEVYADLQRRAQLVARTGGHQPGVGRVQPVRPKVLSVHASFVGPEIAETSLHVRYGPRSRALAARFERRAGRWLCTALEFA